MLPSIANLLAAESNDSSCFYSSADDVSSSSTTTTSPYSPMHHFLHEGFVWESPSSSSSSSPSSPSCSDYSSSPSSPIFATATAKSKKASLSFILNDDASHDNDLAASSFGLLLPQRRTGSVATTSSSTNNKRKRSTSNHLTAPNKERRTTATTGAKERSPLTAAALTGQLTDDQRATLEAMFELDPLPGTCAKVQLADQLGVPLKSVQLWFQNHRSKLRKREKKRIARAEAARRSAGSKPRFIFHNMKAKAQANGFLQQFVVDTH
ncbi:homeobox domain containing protein [Acanthamoeba castellanii str. Neff]|uniref:Homeobox domain containing protein n=1 Tax=Acanthamoeba castellanii (strain ATCC 30010 / Neff) TaxID=1257118 RepID=L8GXK9_ACACF|nr:homeobox domain containing protein [Acanthamoeba castellanii str. Neff]ELR17672.1 homeobox domain containing protein [Acanthamoeba castellanii str. Neff]